MTQEEHALCVAIHDVFVRRMQERGLLSRSYRSTQDSVVMVSRIAVMTPVPTIGLVKPKDLTGLPEKEKKIIVAMGLKHIDSKAYECRWCGTKTNSYYADNEIGVVGCSINCILGGLLVQTGLFKTKLQANKHIKGGAKDAPKKSPRARVRRDPAELCYQLQ